jgi:glycosyltransferase involved in cell wall biosynthesis
MEKPKVLIYTDCFIYGGSERLMIFLLKNKKLNEEFDLMVAFRNHKEYFKNLTDDIKNLKINIVSYPLFAFSNATFFNKLNRSALPEVIKNIIKIPFFLLEKSGLYFVINFLLFILFIRKVRPQIIHVNNGGYPGARSCNQFVLAARMCGVHAIVYQVNNIAFGTANPFSSWCDKFINKYVKYFITASAKAGNALIEKRKFSEEKIVQIPNTVLPEKVTKTRMKILEELQWQEDSFIVVQVAFLTSRKGQVNLIKAVQRLRDEHTSDLSDKIKLILVGDGEDEKVLRKFVSEKNLNDVVYFAGYRSDSVNYINACDIFALPSIANEDMPLSLLTAMSYEKPILATHFAGIAEVITNRENGLLLAPKAETIVEEICNSITELYISPCMRKKLALNAKKAFHELFSEDIYAKRLSNLYAAVR